MAKFRREQRREIGELTERAEIAEQQVAMHREELVARESEIQTLTEGHVKLAHDIEDRDAEVERLKGLLVEHQSLREQLAKETRVAEDLTDENTRLRKELETVWQTLKAVTDRLDNALAPQ